MEDLWTKDQSDQITALYSKLKGKYEREAHQKIYAGPQLDYIDAFKTLTTLIDQQEKGKSEGLERKVKSAPSGLFAGREVYALGLFGILIALGLAASGLPPYKPF